jgi:hypothetical protein
MYYGLLMILRINSDYFPKHHQPIFILVMETRGGFFEVGTEFLNIYMSSGLQQDKYDVISPLVTIRVML